ncbi:MAG: hypothetical protein V4614_12425 [Pseudomonadota bacterium]
MNQALLFSKYSLVLAVLGGSCLPASAQVYRCGGVAGAPVEYINNARDAQARGCKTMQGGNVTVMQNAPVARPPAVRPATATSAGRSADSAEQRARDSDTRSILESELKKAEAKLAEQQKEFNNGEPEKQGIEGKNYQRYLDRVAEMKDSIARNQSDIAGLKREIARLPASESPRASNENPAVRANN